MKKVLKKTSLLSYSKKKISINGFPRQAARAHRRNDDILFLLSRRSCLQYSSSYFFLARFLGGAEGSTRMKCVDAWRKRSSAKPRNWVIEMTSSRTVSTDRFLACTVFSSGEAKTGGCG